MSQSQINRIIEQHGLKSGDTMINIHGDPIEGSCVIDPYTIIHREDGPQGGYRLLSQRPLTGEETSQYISDKALAALRAYQG